MATFTPSKYQQAVYEFVSNGNGNAVISAVAGSGKSTTIVNALNLIPESKSVLFLAFNNAIVNELKLKIGVKPNTVISTLHAFGGRQVQKSIRTILDNNKYRTYMNNALTYGGVKPTMELDETETAEYRTNVRKLVDLYRVNLCANVSDLFNIASKFAIHLIDNECEIAENIVSWGRNNLNTIDFTDMLYLPNVKNISVEKFDFIFIDECQDLSNAQRELMLKALAPNGRFVAVGDRSQAIYGFTGADTQSFDILSTLPNTISLPLSVCYRCGSTIVNLAKEIVPQIEASEHAIDGAIDENAKLEMIKDGDLVLCRNTAPLVALCMQYIAKGVKAYVKGKDIGANLINMLKNTKKRKTEDAIERLNAELNKIASKIVKRTHCSDAEAMEDSTYTTYKDKIDAIVCIANNLKTVDAVIGRIETIFKDEERNGICLSTVHKAKGLESDNVYIICKEKFYNKYAMKIPWMAEQESNIVYVAYTRAKKYLGFVSDFNCD